MSYLFLQGVTSICVHQPCSLRVDMFSSAQTFHGLCSKAAWFPVLSTQGCTRLQAFAKIQAEEEEQQRVPAHDSNGQSESKQTGYEAKPSRPQPAESALYEPPSWRGAPEGCVAQPNLYSVPGDADASRHQSLPMSDWQAALGFCPSMSQETAMRLPCSAC